MSEACPWKTDLVEGASIQVGQREFIPVVKMRSALRRQVTFGTGASTGGGGAIVWLQPVAMIARQSDGSEQRIPISDDTGTVIKGMLIGAFTLPLLYLFASSFAFLWRRRRAKRFS